MDDILDMSGQNEKKNPRNIILIFFLRLRR